MVARKNRLRDRINMDPSYIEDNEARGATFKVLKLLSTGQQLEEVMQKIGVREHDNQEEIHAKIARELVKRILSAHNKEVQSESQSQFDAKDIIPNLDECSLLRFKNKVIKAAVNLPEEIATLDVKDFKSLINHVLSDIIKEMQSGNNNRVRWQSVYPDVPTRIITEIDVTGALGRLINDITLNGKSFGTAIASLYARDSENPEVDNVEFQFNVYSELVRRINLSLEGIRPLGYGAGIRDEFNGLMQQLSQDELDHIKKEFGEAQDVSPTLKNISADRVATIIFYIQASVNTKLADLKREAIEASTVDSWDDDI